MDEESVISKTNYLFNKNVMYDDIFDESRSVGLTKQLCKWGSKCFQKNQSHMDMYTHASYDELNIFLNNEKQHLLSNLNKLLDEITRLVDNMYEKMTDSSISEVVEFINKIKPYVVDKTLFFMPKDIIRELPFNIIKIQRFIDGPLQQLQTGDFNISDIMIWCTQFMIEPLSFIIEQKQKPHSNRRRHKPHYRRPYGGGKRTRRESRRQKKRTKRRIKKPKSRRKKRTVKKALRCK